MVGREQVTEDVYPVVGQDGTVRVGQIVRWTRNDTGRTIARTDIDTSGVTGEIFPRKGRPAPFTQGSARDPRIGQPWRPING